MVDQLQGRLLVAAREGGQETASICLALCCLGIGEVGLTSQRTRPHVAVAEEMTVEELPEGTRGKVCWAISKNILP